MLSNIKTLYMCAMFTSVNYHHLGLVGFLIERAAACCKTDPKLGLTGSKINSSWPRALVNPIDPIKGM